MDKLETLFIGRNRLYYKEVDSSNSQLLSLAQEIKLIEGTTVVSYEQKAGRGQAGNSWQSAPGENLALSILLRPSKIRASQLFLLNMVASLAIFDLLCQFGINAQIKWPNDLYASNKKIAGILVESRLSGERLQHVVLGIGLNINQKDFPKELHACSFATLLGEDFDLKEIEGQLLNLFESYYLQLNKPKVLMEKYLDASNMLNNDFTFHYQGKMLKARVLEMKEDGRLTIESDLGERFQDLSHPQLRLSMQDAKQQD